MVGKVVVPLAIRLACSALIVWMAVPKIGNPQWLESMSIEWVPTTIAWVVGHTLPWLEISLGLHLISPKTWRSAARLTCLLLASFIPVLVIFALEGRADCGCSGPGTILPAWASTPVFGLVRNAGMIAILWIAVRFSCAKVN